MGMLISFHRKQARTRHRHPLRPAIQPRPRRHPPQNAGSGLAPFLWRTLRRGRRRAVGETCLSARPRGAALRADRIRAQRPIPQSNRPRRCPCEWRSNSKAPSHNQFKISNFLNYWCGLLFQVFQREAICKPAGDTAVTGAGEGGAEHENLWGAAPAKSIISRAEGLRRWWIVGAQRRITRLLRAARR